MKKSYKYMILFDIFAFIVLLLNSVLVLKISRYYLSILLVILLIIVKLVFGFEKDRHLNTKNVLLECVIFFLTFYILYYLFGILITFAKPINYYNFTGIFKVVIPIILNIFLKELLRYFTLVKVEKNKPLIVLNTLLFIFIDLTNAFYLVNFSNTFDILVLLGLTILPSISTNVLNTYLALNSGYKPNILINLFLTLPFYLMPIIPNPSHYLKSVIDFLIPVIFMVRIYSYIDKFKDKDFLSDYNDKRKSLSLLIFPITLSLIVVYLVSGYFKYYAIAVGSGSMSETFEKGDVVIINQERKKIKKNINIGDIIAYKHENIVIVHRIINIKNVGDKYYIYTKGDANNHDDLWYVSENDIIGVVESKIPVIGRPTIWLSEL